MSSSSPKHSPWWEAEIEVTSGIADDAAALLVADGAAGVETIGDVTPPPTPLHSDAPTRSPPPPGSALLVATYVTDADMPDADAVIRAVRGAVAPLDARLATAAVRVIVRRDASWAERWKEYFTPLQIGERLWIVPAWEAVAGFAPPEGSIPLLIEPGMAFGTGQHATTALCLRLLERLLTNEPPATLLDVGTGSGILSFAAARLGVERILAVDNDEAALGVAKENLALNSGCDQRISFARV